MQDIIDIAADTVADGSREEGGRSRVDRLARAFGGRRAALDTLVLFVAVVVSFALAVRFDALATLVEWTSDHDGWELDELITLALLGSLALAVFGARRMAELRTEIDRRDQAERRARHIAMHDPLTGLPNRTLFRHRLEQELARARRDDTAVAVLAVDLDRFKHVNDAFGHAIGDALLRAATDRFVSAVRRMDTVARLGGDEFVIIQPGGRQPEGAASLAERLIRLMAQPFELDGRQIVCTLSVGVAFSSARARDAGELLRSADIALYRAKADGRSTFRCFEFDMDTRLRERQSLERDLRAAMAGGEMTLHYQPLANISDRSLIGFEALLRWTHATRGPVSPADFIPLAEETGLIVELGDWVLERACRDAMRWPGDFKVAVNLSPIQFKHRDLPRKVAAVLQRTGLPARRLEVEITEGVLIEDTEATLAILGALKTLGVSISMDDFGTGYSSLSYLKRFPFDKIKIDRSFISHLDSDAGDAAIVRAILAMGHSLGMVATAEGVESDGQLSQLRLEGCDQAQGYLLGRPMCFDEALSLSGRASAGMPL